MNPDRADISALTRYWLEERFEKYAYAWLSRLAWRLRRVDAFKLADELDDALDTGQLSEDERHDVISSALVYRGRKRGGDTDIFLLVEVTGCVRPGDVERAASRAAVLSKLGRPVEPIVFGQSITPEAEALARGRGVWYLPDDPEES